MAGNDTLTPDRKLSLCPTKESMPMRDLIRECDTCGGFLLYCCCCADKGYYYDRPGQLCQKQKLIFTDGACPNNGRPGAKAGMGIAYGSWDRDQFSIPLTESIDEVQPHTSQRAELWAAILGLELFTVSGAGSCDIKKMQTRTKEDQPEWIVVSDSQYVVRGMTEWLPTWERRNYRTSENREPANLDLFLALDKVVKMLEEKSIKISFWHIPRRHNNLADQLAKAAATNGVQKPEEFDLEEFLELSHLDFPGLHRAKKIKTLPPGGTTPA